MSGRLEGKKIVVTAAGHGETDHSSLYKEIERINKK